MLRSIIVSALAVLVLAQPALARTHHRAHHRWHPYWHSARYHHARYPARGIPITAGSDAIRINAVGEVISSPTPVIQKERNFQDRAHKDLAKQRGARPGAPAQP